MLHFWTDLDTKQAMVVRIAELEREVADLRGRLELAYHRIGEQSDQLTRVAMRAVPPPPRWEDEEKATYDVATLEMEFRARLYGKAPDVLTGIPYAYRDRAERERLLTLARQALAAQEARKDEDMQAWADRLAADVGQATD